MRAAKAILRNEGVRRFLCRLVAVYIRVVWWTGRWTVAGSGAAEAYWRDDRPFVLAFWHGRLLMMPYCWRLDKPIHMLISQHRDGRLIANVVSSFGIRGVQGSSSRGGATAIRGMLKILKRGEWAGLTPDGPRGPRMRASEGVVQLARLAGVPVIPATYGAEWGRTLSSWDRFLVPWPFTRGVILWGDPIHVPHDADVEAKRREIEAEMTALSFEADRHTGRDPVRPDPAPAPVADDGAEDE